MKFDSKYDNNGLNEAMIVRAATMVTILGGGECDVTDLSAALSRAPVLVAADGGAGAALAAGHMPDAVIGDMDSLSPEDRAELDPARVHAIAEQNSTDFDKALRSVAAPGVIAVGFTGARLDHELAVYHTLVARRSPPCILLGARDIIFAAPPALALDLDPDARVSLFPMAPVTGRSMGLRWPIDGIAFAPDRQIGTSNMAVTGHVKLSFDAPGMLVILPKRFLDAAIGALIEIPLPSPSAKV